MLKVFQRLIVAALFLVASVLSSELLTQIAPDVLLVSRAQGQDVVAAKMVLISRDKTRDPVKVIKITENGESIHPGWRMIPEIPGKRFAAGDDWIRDLSFELKNLTSLNIVFVSIDIGFPEAAEYTWNIRLGQIPPLAAAAYFNRPRAVIPTGTGHPLQFGPG